MVETFAVSAYYLRGIPRGAIQRLFTNIAGRQETLINRQIGNWTPAQYWRPDQLTPLVQPNAPVVQYDTGILGSVKVGARLNDETSTVALPASSALDDQFWCAVLSCHVNLPSSPAELSVGIENAPPRSIELQSPNIILAGLMPPSGESALFRFKTTPSLVQQVSVPKGDFQPGVYLVYGAMIPLTREHFRREGYSGEYYEIGGLGDSFFIRSGFHIREGMPPHQVRWTEQEFELDLPVWNGTAPQEVSLTGLLPDTISARHVRVTIPACGPNGEVVTGEREISETTYGSYPIPLSSPLAPGVRHFRFQLDGVWVPKERGQGTDPRTLGFYLAGVGIR
ncbi:hypothetical protein HY256_05570 [Candidatus Sumerlaeota bacterium]|nr:hypothetical protein [Candidatus Sumerlaeota bacterium]